MSKLIINLLTFGFVTLVLYLAIWVILIVSVYIEDFINKKRK